MDETGPTESELEFYYFGFHRILKRFRSVTILGWVVVLIGAVSLPVGWKFGQPHGLMDVALSIATIFAGLVVVQQSVAALESYVNVPFHKQESSGEDIHPVLMEIRTLMKEIEEGGWWEANRGIRTIEEIGTKYGFQSIEIKMRADCSGFTR